MSYEDLLKRKQAISESSNTLLNEAFSGRQQARDVADYLYNTQQTLGDLSGEFQRKTSLDARDQAIMFLAIALQIARQYCLTSFPERMDDQAAAKSIVGKTPEHSDRKHRLYNPSLAEIINNPVPFDANIGSGGSLVGGGALGHRATAIGHDPILGLIFGTSNITTSTLTTSSMESFHIYTGEISNGHGTVKRDVFTKKAQTSKILVYTKDKLLHGDMNDRCIVATSLVKEVIHLKSDLYTMHSLPVPIVSYYSPQLASDLALRGLDMANIVTVGKQAEYAILINTLVALFHGLFFEGASKSDRRLYEVKTRKVLLYSNIVASSSNLAVVALTRNLKKLDLGGLAVTLYRLATDVKFIAQVKYDFISGSYFAMLDQL